MPWGICMGQLPTDEWSLLSRPTVQELWDQPLDEMEADRQRQAMQVLWPAPYNKENPKSAYLWLTQCWWTNDEAAQRTDLVPPKPYVEWFCEEWVKCYLGRVPLVIEKSRRMVISWMARGLETWACGFRRSEWLIVDQTLKNAAEHLWRVHFSLDELRRRRPELGLPVHVSLGAVLSKEPTDVILANGSTLTAAHQKAAASQGKGKTGITLEELSKYQSPSAFWNQATLLTQGPGGEAGGWVCGIANADPDPDWRAIKSHASARQLLGLDI